MPSKPSSSEPASQACAVPPREAANFIRDIVRQDLERGEFGGVLVTRFAPEPNGHLHLGHAYSAGVSFQLAREFGGVFHLRFDDTNPVTEQLEYVQAQQDLLRWLGIEWGEKLFFASDYFEAMYGYARQLIEAGKAYVCELGLEQLRAQRGSYSEPGVDSPYRERPIEQNLELFAKMRAGALEPGSAVLRARIDMRSPVLALRDPVMYRIVRAHHFRQGERWCIYPLYDWAHPIEDSLEGITHSLCGLEFENNRPLYDWYLEQLGIHHPKQIEFSRLNLSYTVMGKRWLSQLVEGGAVQGWDDPRLPTLSGLRRRGVPPEAIHEFLSRISVAKSPTAVDVGQLEYCVRQQLYRQAPRAMAVLRPLRAVIENFPAGQVQWLQSQNNPEDPAAGTRRLPFSREVFIERDDFHLNPPAGYFRLSPGGRIRLKDAYVIRCESYVLDPRTGEPSELRCTYEPDSRGPGDPPAGKVKVSAHWVSAAHAVPATVRLYERLFRVEAPGASGSLLDALQPDSLRELRDCMLEPALAQAAPGARFQFVRQGYFACERGAAGELAFNQTVSLKDAWARAAGRGPARAQPGALRSAPLR